MGIRIRPARPGDHAELTKISFASKRHWNDPEEYYLVWKEELTVTSRYILENCVYVAEAEGKPIGYFSIVEVKKDFHAGKVLIWRGHWLEHLFLHPSYIGKGIGTRLMHFAESYCREKGIPALYLFNDPHANGFYDKMGATYLRKSPSSIAGRTVSVYKYSVV